MDIFCIIVGVGGQGMTEQTERLAIHTSFDPHVDEVLFAGQSQTGPIHVMGPRIYTYYLVHYILSGTGELSVQGKTYSLKAGDSFFIVPNENFRYASSKHNPWRYCWVGFTGNRMKQLLQRSNISAAQPIIYNQSQEKLYPYFKRIYEALQSNKQYAVIQANAYLQLLLAEYNQINIPNQSQHYNNKSTSQRHIEEAIAYIEYNYPNSFTMEELSQRIGYHHSHFCKLFKQTTGVAPLHYLIRVRLEQSKQLLAQHIPVGQTALAVGFADPLYFSKLFKRHFGLTPSQYEKQYGHE